MIKFSNIVSPSVVKTLEEHEKRELYKEYLEINERLERQRLIDFLTLGKEKAIKKNLGKLNLMIEEINQKESSKKWLNQHFRSLSQ